MIIPKSEYQLILDPELNQGNKYMGIFSAIEQAQQMMQPEVVFPVRIVVHKKMSDYFSGNPYQFTITFDNTGLPSHQRGILKIRFI